MTARETIKGEKRNWKPHRLTDVEKDKIKKFFMGSREKEGFLKQFVVYALLICIGFIYLYPILYMFSSSLMTLDDLLDTSINWIPSSLNLKNYAQAGSSMNFWPVLGLSIIVAGVPTLLNVLSCSIVGYGLARFEFPGKKIMMGIIIFTFILPSQVTMIPTYVLYSNLKILSTLWAFVVPSLLAQGINASIFILIFYQFFKQVPKVLIEAAQIDGAGYFKSFVRISLPSAAPAILTVFLFSFVWYWNNSYLTRMYVSGVMTQSKWTTLVVQLQKFGQLQFLRPDREQRRCDIERVHQHGRYHAQYPAHPAHVFCAPEILCGEHRPGGYYGRIRVLLVKTLDKFSVG